MAFNTYPYSPFPASTEQLHRGDNEELQEQIEELHEQIGDLSDLETSTKTSVVGAVNEVNTGLTGLAAHVDNDTDHAFAESITINNAVPSPAKNLKVKIVPTQSGTGTPSPDNVRPITGDTEASVSTTDGTNTNTATIALGQTVYGGEVDFDSGVVTVDRVYCKLADQTLVRRATNESGIYRFAFAPSPAVQSGRYVNVISNALVSKDAYASYQRTAENSITPDSEGNYINFYASDKQTDTDWITFATDNDVEIVYPLATPTTLNLTPAELTLLRGNNTVTTENNQVSLTASGVVGAIGELAEEVAANKLVNYSATEQKTGQKWIDGKPIYQKTWDFGDSPVSITYNSWTSLGVTISNFGKLVHQQMLGGTDGEIDISGAGIELSVNADGSVSAEYNLDTNRRVLKILTLQYTKTT